MKRLVFNGRDIKNAVPLPNPNKDGPIRSLPKDEQGLQVLVSTRRYLERLLLEAHKAGDNHQVTAISLKLKLLKDAQSGSQAAKAMQEDEDFSKWLLGRGPEEDHVRTPWYRTPLTNTVDGARKYIEVKMEARRKFIEELATLKMCIVPRDVEEAYKFWKYVVKGLDEGQLTFLEDWSGIRDIDGDIMRYGSRVAEKLEAWWTKGAILPDEDVQLLATDFDAYMKFVHSVNPADREKHLKSLQLRADVLEKLAMNQHHPTIKKLLVAYQDNGIEVEDQVLYNTNALLNLDAEEKRLRNVYNTVGRFAQYSTNPTVRNEFQRKFDEIKTRRDAIQQALDRHVRTPEEMERHSRLVEERLRERAERESIPREVLDAIAHGDGQDLVLASNVNSLESLVREADSLITAVTFAEDPEELFEDELREVTEDLHNTMQESESLMKGK
jgi:hypothetical protein